MVVIGRSSFAKAELARAALNGRGIAFVSQEALINFVLFGHPPDYYPGDLRIEEHAGLKFLSELGFKWPSTFAQKSTHASEEEFEREEESWLRKTYGYSVARTVPVNESRHSLRSAVDGEGLQPVAEFVAWLARSWKRMDTDRFDSAIARWESDLAWLKREYYYNSVHEFRWPSAED